MKRSPVIHLGTFPGLNSRPNQKPFPWLDLVLAICALGFILGAVLSAL